ncbi:MAG TPA: hypothetical protein PKD18_05065 [Saprospiraceae bacterium]|nr:hypothetical protein [Saprospiraceae bacterium]
MSRPSIKKYSLAFVVVLSLFCYYHLNYCVEYSGSSEMLISNLDYVEKFSDKDDKLKDILVVIINSFVQTSL